MYEIIVLILLNDNQYLQRYDLSKLLIKINQSINQSIDRSLTHSLTHSLTYSLTHSLNQSISPIFVSSISHSVVLTECTIALGY